MWISSHFYGFLKNKLKHKFLHEVDIRTSVNEKATIMHAQNDLISQKNDDNTMKTEDCANLYINTKTRINLV